MIAQDDNLLRAVLVAIMKVDALIKHDRMIGLEAPNAPFGGLNDDLAAAFDH